MPIDHEEIAKLDQQIRETRAKLGRLIRERKAVETGSRWYSLEQRAEQAIALVKEGKTEREIAAIHGVTLNTAKGWLEKAAEMEVEKTFPAPHYHWRSSSSAETDAWHAWCTEMYSRRDSLLAHWRSLNPRHIA